MKRLIKAGHLIRYVKEVDYGAESGPLVDNQHDWPIKSRLAINYIQGGPSDDQYQWKCQQKKLLRASIVKVGVNVIHKGGSREETKPIDGPISFPPVNRNRVIVPHYDALGLTLCIIGFDVQKVLVDPDSAVNLLQLPTFNQMKLYLGMLNSVRQILSGFNDTTTTILGDIMPLA